MSNTPKTPADAGPDLQRAVRPLYYWHDGPNGDCFRVETDEAESDAPCPHCAPRYDQAALDAAVAAERERRDTEAVLNLLIREKRKTERMREALQHIAQHFSSEWPERCQTNVLTARNALVSEA